MIDAEEFFGRGHLALFHGSREVVARPAFGRGNVHNATVAASIAPSRRSSQASGLARPWRTAT